MTFMSTTGTSPVPPPGGPRPPGVLRMTRGRWVALAVAVPVAIALIGWTGFGLVTAFARGSYPFSYAIPVDNGQVAVNITAGNITLRPGSAGTAALTGVVQYGLIPPSISENTTPTGADIGVGCDGFAAGNCGMNANLDVPAHTAVTLWSNGGDIGVSGFSASMTLSAEGGNVTASNLTGDLKLDTGGGDLAGTGLTGQIDITAEGGNVAASNLDGAGTIVIDTGGGDLNANGVTGDVSFRAEGGNINGDGVDSQQAFIDSGGGDVTLVFAQPPQNLQVNAEGGNVTVILPPGSIRYDIATNTEGGNLNYPISLFDQNSPDKITVDSGGGDITIGQS